MPDLELRFYKRWCYVFVALQFFTASLAWYISEHPIKDHNPVCEHIEAKYQFLLQHGQDDGPEAIAAEAGHD